MKEILTPDGLIATFLNIVQKYRCNKNFNKLLSG